MPRIGTQGGIKMKSAVGQRRPTKVIMEPTKDLALLKTVRDY